MEVCTQRTKYENNCRTCLAVPSGDYCIEMYDIFANTHLSTTVAEILALCTTLKVSKEDKLPKKLCEHCYNCLIKFYEFRISAENIYEQLNKDFNYVDVIIETQKVGSVIDVKVEDKTEEDTVDSEYDIKVEYGNQDFDFNNDYTSDQSTRETDLDTKDIDHLKILDVENDSTSTTFPTVEGAEEISKCKFCGKDFLNHTELEQHIKRHRVSNVFNCGQCEKSFRNRGVYRKHLLLHASQENTENSITCQICSAEFQSQKSLSGHMKAHKMKNRILACPVCNKVFKKVYHLKRHKLTHEDDLPLNLIFSKSSIKEIKCEDYNSNLECQICFTSYNHEEELDLHMKDHIKANAKKVFPCPVCNKVFHKIYNFKRHTLTECKSSDQQKNPDSNENEIVNECNLCSRKFECSFSLAAHMKIHTKKNRVLACSICKKVFKKTSHLKRHELCHDENRPFQCDICKKRFNTEGLLHDHMMKHNKVKQHICPMCSKAFAHQSSLSSHLKLHTRGRQYLCPSCGKGFHSSTNLNQHLLRHLGDKVFKCSLCPSQFFTKGELKKHTATHSGAKPESCDQCGSKFTTRSTLRLHKMRHAGLKPFQCDACPMKFVTKAHLVRHHRTHTGERPYRCGQCARAFAQSNDLAKHRRAHASSARLHQCPECEQSFRLKSELRSHISVHYISRLESSKPSDDQPSGVIVKTNS